MTSTLRKMLIGGGLAVATLAGGAVGAALTNNAAGAQTSTTTSTPAADGTTPTTAVAPAEGAERHGGRPGGDHGARAEETALTGSDLEKATAAAKQAVPDGTVERAETEGDTTGGAAYEVHVTKADGSRATVKLDSNFNVVRVDQGGAGCAGRGRGHGGGADEDAGTDASNGADTDTDTTPAT